MSSIGGIAATLHDATGLRDPSNRSWDPPEWIYSGWRVLLHDCAIQVHRRLSPLGSREVQCVFVKNSLINYDTL